MLRTLWNRVERLWEQAEVAPPERSRRRITAKALTRAVCRQRPGSAAWNKASIAFHKYEQEEGVGSRPKWRASVFRPDDGQLNDRTWAQGQVALALPHCSSQVWSKVRGFLKRRSRSRFWIGCHDRSGPLPAPSCSVTPSCTCGGFVGNDPGKRARRPWGVITIWLWYSRFSARNSTRTGGNRTGRLRRC